MKPRLTVATWELIRSFINPDDSDVHWYFDKQLKGVRGTSYEDYFTIKLYPEEEGIFLKAYKEAFAKEYNNETN